MTAAPAPEPGERRPPAPRARPLYFGDPAPTLFGMLHVGAAPACDLGLVLCNPYGYEAVCTHRLYRQIAEHAAAAGVPALRFDYPGCGDSAGDGEGDCYADWAAGIEAACQALQQQAGVAHVALCGLRLGALLALQAAARIEAVVGVAALAPVASGRAYVRELRALALAGNLPPPPGVMPGTDGIEPAGYLLNAVTAASLSACELGALRLKPAQRVLLLERDDRVAGAAAAPSLQYCGALVESATLGGYAALMQDPHRAVVPPGLCSRLVTWMCTLPGALAHAVPRPGAAPDCPAPVLQLPAAAGSGTMIEESAVDIPGTAPLFAIITRAAQPLPQGPGTCLLLLNSGAIHRAGPGRLYVQLARQLAAEGFTVLRLDLEGIGDSPAAAAVDNVVYMDAAVANVSRACDYARLRLHAQRCDVAGICSGAYHSLKAAAQDVPLSTVIPINPLVYFWKPGLSLDVPPHRATAEARRLGQRALRLEAWRKLLRGEVAVGNAWRIYRHRIAALLRHTLRDLQRGMGMTLREDLAAELCAATAHGRTLHFIFAAGEPGLTMLREAAGRTSTRLERQGRLHVDVVAGADHTFTPGWARALLVARVRAALGLPAGGPP